MQITLSKEANQYINATIFRVGKTNKVNREIRRKLERLAARFNPESEVVELKRIEAESVQKLLQMMIEMCDSLSKADATPEDRKELAVKRKEIFNAVNSRIAEALKANPR